MQAAPALGLVATWAWEALEPVARFRSGLVAPALVEAFGAWGGAWISESISVTRL
jgi:hypothetical protein